MKQLELSVAADADLFDILAYGTAAFGEAASDSYYLGLCDAFDFLCERPLAGESFEVDDLALRRWLYRQHRIFYRVDADAILIVRVLHVATDAVRWLESG